MSASALRIGDQLILEEDYDENYIPSEQEIHEYAREIGIDPEREPELLWLAREGIVAPLPAEWKPCQDVTGDVYYFNFSTGQSTWDHPCDEQYRCLVAQERERTPGSAPVRKDKEKKKKKEKKKEKKKKSSEPEGVKAPGPLSPLAPLRSVCDTPVPALRRPLGSSSSLQPLKTPLGGALAGTSSGLQRVHQEERPSLSPPMLSSNDREDGEEKISMPRSPCGTSRLLQNLQLDLDGLGGGLRYEDSEVSGTPPAEERTEPELQDLALSGEISAIPPSPSPSQDSLRGRRLSLEQLGGSGECSSAEVFPPSRQDESVAEEEAEEGSREDEEVEVERQSRDRDEEEAGKWQREESGCDTETKSGGETQNARDEATEDRKTPDTSDEIMERYVEYAGEEEERSERGRREEGETERDVQHEVVEDEVGEEEEGMESCRRSSEEQRGDRRTKTERKTSSKPPEEDQGNDDEPKVTKISESEEEIERLESAKGNAGTSLQKIGTAGEKKKPLQRCDRLPSEESEISKHLEVVSSHSDDMKVGFRFKFSENVLDVTDLCLAEPSAAPKEKEKYGGREEYDDYEEEEEEEEEEKGKHEAEERTKRMPKEREEEERRRRQEDEHRTRRDEEEEEARRQAEQERLRVAEECDRRLRLLREELRKEEEEEERRIKEENEERIRALKERLERERREEEERLDQEKHTKLEQLRVQALRDTHLHTLREENEERARELRAELEAERERLEVERRRDLDKMRAESEEELKAEKMRLQERREEQLASLRLEETASERQQNLRSPRPQQQLLDYKRELSDVLQEVREEVQKEHSRKLEQLKEEHRIQLQAIRETHLEEESNQRERVMSALQEERERLLTSHTAQLEQLRLQLDTQLHNMHKTHTQKEAEVQGLIEKLQLKTKELKIQESTLLTQAADLKKRRKQLDEEEDEVERGLETLPQSESWSRESADFEEEEKKEGEREEESRNRAREETLRVEDLERSPSCDTHSNIEQLREFITSESVSLQRARQFLDRQTGNLTERQAMLKAARTTVQDPTPAGVVHLFPQNLQQEASRLEELKETVQKGHTLLRKKEERLSQLENSLLEELSCDDAERTEAERRVTFDVTDSETSSAYCPEGTVPGKVQQLADSLQQISGQLNAVLGALGSLTQRTSTSFPPTTSSSSKSWFPNAASSNQKGFATLRGSDLLLSSNWRKPLPGVTMETGTAFSTRAHTAYSGYMPTSLSSMMQSKSSELDSLRLHGLIEGNKRWLETRRKDINVPLFTRYQVPPSTNGLVQLSLDENNQIRVHHY
ncbi:hypothetical protein AMELA_G00098560 [Ameiurus melas]|uniref:Centrosomal protein of 164 kDa n=1 Tax=Ameiurus melas TaxID=219545 RepID=A0A7J6AUC5_AMEME|nr:hypothetical protein AMELA_G00098560 [Ameiurus melas]